ncbi:MAG: PEGA domain-containing protein [Thermoanaerobaculia bacterium]|nr:PEGA domain-containing protein [Thermoanaerobaculia bacterium]
MKTRHATLRRSIALAAIATLVALSPGAAQRAASTRPTADDPPPASATRRAVPRGGEPAARTPSSRHRPGPAAVHRTGRHPSRVYLSPYRWWFGWSGYYHPGWAYAPHYWHYWPVVPSRARAALADLGGLDLNVRPKKAEVYVDGVLVGTAGRYDGFPGHLWLPSGAHELVFYRPGFRTVSRQVTVPPGALLDVNLRMEPGEARPPEEVASPRVATAAPRPAPPPAAGEARTLDLRGDPGRFQIRVEPADASVYLDGRFLGTGGELARLHAGLMVDPGTHELQVVRPGYRPRAERVSVEAGEELELSIVLEAEAGS